MNLDDLQKLCDEATPGPWTHHRQQHCPQINCHEIELRTCHGGALYRSTSYGLMEVDGEFICAARTEMPKLLERVRKLETAAKDARDIIDSLNWATDTTNGVIKTIDALLAEGKE